jgi:hypothetical protein
MDDIGVLGAAFILVVGAATTVVFIVVPVLAAIDAYRSRDTWRHAWPFIATTVATIPFFVGGLLGIGYFLLKRRRRAPNP